jgi:hypothetical protein
VLFVVSPAFEKELQVYHEEHEEHEGKDNYKIKARLVLK